MARIAAVVVGVVAILGGIAANGQNIAFLVGSAVAVAASGKLPTILYSLFWKRFNTRGLSLAHLRRTRQRWRFARLPGPAPEARRSTTDPTNGAPEPT